MRNKYQMLQPLCLHCRDVVYLDLALDGAVRSSVEAALSLFKAAFSSTEEQERQAGQLIQLTTLCVENVCLTSGSNVEMVMVLKDYQVMYHLPSHDLSASLGRSG